MLARIGFSLSDFRHLYFELTVTIIRTRFYIVHQIHKQQKMKKVNQSIKWAAMCLCVVSLFSCTKTIDSSKDSISVERSDDLTFPITNEFADCKIRSIYHTGLGGMVRRGVFTYNNGKPVSLVYDQTNTGFQNHYFQYDKLGRLKSYRLRYTQDDPTEEEMHQYGYDANNRIITDTIPNFSVSTFTYDSQERIIKENIRYNNPGIPTRNPTFTYDNRGNLAVAGWKSSSYDNKVSIFRSNPVFQFIFRNYSKNNAASQAKYNSKGLPLSMNPANDDFFNAGPTASYASNITRVLYDCQ